MRPAPPHFPLYATAEKVTVDQMQYTTKHPEDKTAKYSTVPTENIGGGEGAYIIVIGLKSQLLCN